MVSANTMCQNYKSLSDQEDDLEQCAEKVGGDEECEASNRTFFHKKDDKLCGCCTSTTPMEDSYPFNGELHLYQQDRIEKTCHQENCMTCAQDDENECIRCEDGFKNAFGSCFNFEF